jgi:two-component system, chemotaxis family, protein-glutamate methylesterase/glutaminase
VIFLPDGETSGHQPRGGPVRDDTASYPLTYPVVALVTSAGGLDALTRVLGPMPSDLPAAVVVVQHLDPEHGSTLAAILDGRTALDVRSAGDGDAMAVGSVLVAPPAHHLLITSQGRLALIDSDELPPARPSADLLLATMAVTCGPRALAVVLTGRGTDAQAGIRAVHRCGGTVFAQDEATAQQFGMPQAAIGTGLVDAVFSVDDLSRAIVEHVAAHG